MKKRLRFGIISGAGPMAGALLYQRIVTLCQQSGAWRDDDFPEILILNFPFAEMLEGVLNPLVRQQLLQSLAFISQNTDFVYIACQTLHAFLYQEDFQKFKIVSLLDLVKQAIVKQRGVIVVASKTSRLMDLHKLPYVCSPQTESAIISILKGHTPDLTWLESLAKQHTVVLGCTEFSVALQHSAESFIDPIELAAQDIVAKFIS